jgi:hypothetical protein
MPEPKSSFLADLLYTGGEDFRENFQGPGKLPIGAPSNLTAEELTGRVRALEPLGQEAFSAIGAAREGNPEQLGRIKDLLGNQDLSQNELANIQRFFEGRRIANEFGPLAGPINAGYEGVKALSQKLGYDEIGGPLAGLFRPLAGGDLQMSAETATASPGSKFAADLGIQSFREGNDRFTVPQAEQEPESAPSASPANFLQDLLGSLKRRPEAFTSFAPPRG